MTGELKLLTAECHNVDLAHRFAVPTVKKKSRQSIKHSGTPLGTVDNSFKKLPHITYYGNPPDR